MPAIANVTEVPTTDRTTFLDAGDGSLMTLVAYCYGLLVPQQPDTAHQLLAAAGNYGLPGLKVACERQVAAQLTVENAVAAAVLAERHSCPGLTAATVEYIKEHTWEVMLTDYWTDALENAPDVLKKICHLVTEALLHKKSAPPEAPSPPPAVLSLPPPEERLGSSAMSAVDQTPEVLAMGRNTFLNAGCGGLVMLVAGETQLLAHRAVLAAQSPTFAAKLAAVSSCVEIPDMEGPVLEQLVAYCYGLPAPQLPDTAPQLLAAADKYGLPGLKAACGQQVAAQLTGGNVVAAAVLAQRHSCPILEAAAVDFVREHPMDVVALEHWADALETATEAIVQISFLLCAARLNAEWAAETRSPGQEGASKPFVGLLAVPLTRRVGNTEVFRWLPLFPTPAKGQQEATTRAVWSIGAGAGVCGSYQWTWSLPPWAENVGPVGALMGHRVDGADRWQWKSLFLPARKTQESAVTCPVWGGARVVIGCPCVKMPLPLHEAVTDGRTIDMRLLLTGSVDPDTRNKDGESPLHWAARCGRVSSAAVLLDAGADRGLMNNSGQTPLDIAMLQKRQLIIELLRK